MTDTHINPPWLEPNDYVEFLNRCFPGTWNLASFNWYLRRGFEGRATDIAVRSEGKTLLAMVAVCYRRVLAPQGRLADVGIMLAGGTLPREQRRGHYSALMQASLDIGRERHCEALLGFVTRQNASGRGLSRLGAHSIESFYISSPQCFRISHTARTKLRTRNLNVAQTTQWARAADNRAGEASHVRFSYADTADWAQQFLRRANPVRAVQVAHDSAALLESVGNVDRLQWLDCPRHRTIATIASLAESSCRARRGFFMYTMDPLLAQATARIGLRVGRGFLKILPVDHTSEESVKTMAMQPWRLQSGDRM